MSIILPTGTTLQYSTSEGNIHHQGIQSSNIDGTQILPVFPVSTTGTSTGNYNHLGIDGQNNNKWDFLNVSGTKSGGYNFWHSSSILAPLLVASIDDVGLTIDRSTDIATLIPLPTVTISGATFAITETPINVPPWNITGYGTPIQVLHNTANLTVETTYYAAGLSSQTVQIATNPDGTGILDTSDLSSAPQPILATLGGSPIVTTKTSILTGDGLYIKNDPNFASTVLTTTGLFITDTSDNQTNIASNLITVQDSSSYNTQINSTSFNINGNAKTVAITENDMTITDASNNNSVLSATSLVITDNTVSTTVNNYSVGISDGISSSLLNSTNLTFGGRSYAQNQVVPTLIYSSPAIYADGHDPATSLSIRANYGYSGWYYKNSPPNTSPTNKINWYFPPSQANFTTVADLKGIAISFFNGNTTSNDNTLFLTVYTVVTGSNDYAPGFFHSANTYVFNQTITPVANTNYQGVAIIDKSFVPSNYETQIQYQPSTVNNPKGTYSQTDKILAVVIGTNSASATNSVELVVNKFNLIYANFTQSYLLIPP
jgi:hypothetical protein